MAGLALVTPRTAVQGGHGLTVKTMFRFNPSSPNKGDSQRVYDVAGVGCLGYWRVPEVGRPHSRSGDQTYRLGCVDEVPLRGFPRVNPVLRFKA